MGDAGEELTCKYLESHNYSVITRNYESAYGEIDIIARSENLILFVEVKSRFEDSRYDGKSAVTRKKQLKIIKTALKYQVMAGHKLQPRFDVAEIYFTKDRKAYIHYIEAAFQG